MRANPHQAVTAGYALSGLVAVALLGACVAQPQAMAPRGAMVGDYAVQTGGMAFSGQLREGAPGTVIGAGGAARVAGLEVAVTGQGASLARDQGLIAKAAAQAVCTSAGGVYNARAIGQYNRAGSWIFSGACA